MAGVNKKTSDENTGGALKNSDIFRYSEDNGSGFDSKKHTMQSLKSYVLAGLVTPGNRVITPEDVAASADPAYILGDGTPQTGASYGKDLTTFQNDFPLADITSVDDLVDTAAINQALLMTATGNTQNEVHLGLYGLRKYVVDKNLTPPKSLAKSSPQKLDIVGHGSMVFTTSDVEDIIKSLPDDQTERNNVTVNALLRIYNLTLSSLATTTKGSGQALIRIGGRDVILYDVLFGAGDLAVDLQGCLGAIIEKCSATGFQTTGFHVGPGLWAGASDSNAAANVTRFLHNRVNLIPGQDYGFHIEDASDTKMWSNEVEGEMGISPLSAAPLAAIFYDTLNATAAKGTFKVDGLYLEQFFKDACIKMKGREGIFSINDMSNQNQGSDDTDCRNYLELDTYTGQLLFQLDRFAHWLPFGQFNLVQSSCHPLFIYPWSVPDADFLNDPAFWSGNQPSLSMLQKSLYHG